MKYSGLFLKLALALFLALMNSTSEAGMASFSLQSANTAAVAANCDLSKSSGPQCFHARALPVVKIVLASYGNPTTRSNLSAIGALLKERFDLATDRALTLEIIDTAVIPLKNYSRDLSPLEKTIQGDASRSIVTGSLRDFECRTLGVLTMRFSVW